MAKIRSLRLARTLLAAISIACFVSSPAAALDLFARHQVTIQFATSDGKPMADTEVRVFAPGQPEPAGIHRPHRQRGEIRVRRGPRRVVDRRGAQRK